jgi:hypothetical protein
MFTFITSVLLAFALADAPSVKLKVNHQVSTAPAKLRFTVSIPPFAGNRKACLVIDGGEYQSSCWQVVGDKHPQTEWFERRIGGGGEYFATVTLASVVDDKLVFTTDTTQFIVTEPGVPFVR